MYLAKFCPNCGNKVEENDKFCIYCGNKLRVIIPEKKVKRSSNSINDEKTSKYVEVIDGLMRYKVFPSSLPVKYIIYKVNYGTTSDEIKDILENGNYNYKINIHYFLQNKKLYFRSPKNPNMFFKFHNDRFNEEMRKDNKEIIHISSYARVHRPSLTKIFNFNQEKTFILANKHFEENIRKTRL